MSCLASGVWRGMFEIMSINFSRRTVLAFLMFGAADAALANAPLQSQRPIQKPVDAAKRALPGPGDLVAQANLGGDVGFVVADARTGKVLESYKPLKSQPPASVAKAVTAMFALETLGATHRYRTRLIATGSVSNGVLSGDLVLVGGGDPTLDTDDLFEMASRLKTAGIREVRGKLKVTAGGFPSIGRIDGEQPDHVGYNPALSGLNLNFNRVYLEWKRSSSGYQITMDARTNNIRPAVGFARTTIADVFKFSSANGRDNWSVARGALGKNGGRWLPVRRPEIYAGDVFQTVARSHGIVLPFPVKTNSVPKGRLIAEHLSDDLSGICRDMLKFSTNLTAEIVGLTASQSGSLTSSGSKMSGWVKARHGLNKAKFVDHSGLGDRSRISASEMVRALVGSGAGGSLRPLLKEIAVRDDKGRPIQNGPIKVVAKTGTLNFVSALAGFIRTPDGRDLAFAIFASDVPRRRALKKSERESPRGAKTYNGRAKRLQQALIKRWAVVHGT
jgi:D-alanyl-D-alanine carboxypeptidase/D-alanyl-D-alanine-endopeptidase (penicillin-binding protein 4)